MKKRGQMKLSFGMIFSIILIILFIVFAIYAVQKFLSFQKELKYKTFVDEFQEDINKMWKSSQGSKEVSYTLPLEIRSICFIQSIRENLIYKGKKNRKGEMFEYIDIEKTLELENTDALCINGF